MAISGECHLKSLRQFVFLILALAMITFGLAMFWRQKAPTAAIVLSPEEWRLRGMLGIQTRDAAELRKVIDGFESLGDSEEQVLLFRGALHLFQNRADAALEEFAKLKPEGPVRPHLLLLTGEALYRVGQLDNAEKCLELAIQDTPESVDALRWLATVSYDLGEIERTLRILSDVSRLAPEDYRPHHMQGAIYRDFGEHQKAITELTDALKHSTATEVQNEIRILLASSQMSLKQFDAALLTLQECPDTTTSYSLKADCLWQSGKTDEAREMLTRAESRGELLASGKRLKARILIEQNELDNAKKILETLIAADQGDDESHYLLALLFRRLQNEDGYQLHLKRSDSIKALKNQLTELSQKATQEPANAEVRDQLAAICDQLGLKPLAKIWRTAALSCRRRPSTAAPLGKDLP